MIEKLIEIIAGAMVGALAAAGVAYFRVRKYQLAAKTAQVLTLEVRAHEALRKLVDNSMCQRALVLALHNGGGRLLAGAPKYASAVHEVHDDTVEPIAQEFQRFELDIEYIVMMEQVKARKIIFLTTDAMKESMLKRRYQAAGITAAIVASIAETPNRYYYASFSTTGNPDDFVSGASFARMETVINELRNMYAAASRGGYLA